MRTTDENENKILISSINAVLSMLNWRRTSTKEPAWLQAIAVGAIYKILRNLYDEDELNMIDARSNQMATIIEENFFSVTKRE